MNERWCSRCGHTCEDQEPACNCVVDHPLETTVEESE